MSNFWIIVGGLISMCLFEVFKLIIAKYAPSFHEKAKAYYSWVIWAVVFVILYFVNGGKYHNWLPIDALINSGFITGMAVYGYELLKPLFKKVLNK